ncbi:MAG: AarF/ABC1/UbiB kinase family protein [Deltaproteobacteria bacterium]|nr:AarF/ABC1/UbiB kinase family protein [Deltaproteobacteria bacterium]
MDVASLSSFRILQRSLAIVALVVGQGLRWLVGHLVLLVAFAGQARRQAWFGQCLLDLFRHLGATFIKVGQIMSTRPDLVPEHITHALAHLQDDVGPFSYDAVARTIAEDLGRPIERIFSEFSVRPIASASVAQVHKARLPDGRVVAVKVRRPDVVEICAFDLAVMRKVARLLAKIPSLAAVSPESSIEQFGRAIHAQLDFRIEARNNRRFRENFHNEPEVVFPEVLGELSSERILCMSHIEGTKILDTPKGRGDGKRIARLGLRALLKMIFEDGFVHADLHPGNIFVLPDQRIAMVDLGLVGELDPPHRASFLRFFAAWANRDADTMAHLLYALALNPSEGGTAFEDFRVALGDLVQRTSVHRMAEVHPGKVLLDMLGLLRRHRVRMAPAFTIVNIAIAVTEGIGRQLDPELDIMAEALPFFVTHPALLQPSATAG